MKAARAARTGPPASTITTRGEENISLAAMEAALRPQVLEVFDAIAKTQTRNWPSCRASVCRPVRKA